LSFFEELEKNIDRRVRAFFQAGENVNSGREIIEIQRAILDDLDSRVEKLPRDRRVFPFNDVVVRVTAPSAERRAVFEMVFLEDESLQQDALEHLRRQGVAVSPEFRLRAELMDEDAAPERLFYVICRNRQDAPDEKQSGAVPTVRLQVLSGSADAPLYALTQRRINMGRLPEVRSREQRVIRRNDVAFADSKEPPTSTVSRSHAHIQYDSEALCFRLFDDGSRFGTTVVREGEVIRVPSGGGRGFKLISSDEIHLGSARVLFLES
jgi:hypothetical protein